LKILLATDGSEFSESAAQFLTRLNLSTADEIFIFHVINWVPILSEWESLYPDFQELRREIAPKILESAADILKGVPAKISRTFTEGYPDKIIVDTVRSADIDLVVMGAKGSKGIGKYLIGSVTKHIAIDSPKPVLIIKPAPGKISGNMKNLFSTDGSAYSEAAGNMLTSIPFPEGTEITILNVIFSSFMDIPERFAIEIENSIKEGIARTREKEMEESEKIIAKTRQQLLKKFPKSESITKFGYPSTEILNTADSMGADLLVVGSRGMRGIRGMLGSVSRNILNHARCSVLIGKGE
jgi:nucleotide-binding universal stress UspA family protein